MENERLLQLPKLLVENGLDERVILALEAIPELAVRIVSLLNGARTSGFTHAAPKSGAARRSEEQVFAAVDELARRGVPVNIHRLGKHLGYVGNAIYMRHKANPEFAQRLKAKIASVNGSAK